MFRGLRPDVTPAQVVAVLLAGVPVISNLLHAFIGFELSPEQQQALTEAVQWGGISALGLFVSDAGLRAARNAREAKVETAALVKGAAPRAEEPADTSLYRAGAEQILSDAPDLHDGERDLLAELDGGELPTDEEEFAAPPDEQADRPPEAGSTDVDPAR